MTKVFIHKQRSLSKAPISARYRGGSEGSIFSIHAAVEVGVTATQHQHSNVRVSRYSNVSYIKQATQRA